jgi:hypothetical protein
MLIVLHVAAVCYKGQQQDLHLESGAMKQGRLLSGSQTVRRW